MPQITALVVAHNRLLRDGLAGLLNEQPDLTATATGPAWDGVQTLVLELKPQVVVLSSTVGAEYAKRLLDVAQPPELALRVIVMDMLGAPEEVIEFVAAGCAALILKDATAEDFVTTIRAVARGASVLPPALTETIFSCVVRRAAGRSSEVIRDTVKMTAREREVTNLIAEGLSNKEIADRLHIAVHTVKCHVHVILEKLALHTRLEIAAHTHRERQRPD